MEESWASVLCLRGTRAAAKRGLRSPGCLLAVLSLSVCLLCTSHSCMNCKKPTVCPCCWINHHPDSSWCPREQPRRTQRSERVAWDACWSLSCSWGGGAVGALWWYPTFCQGANSQRVIWRSCSLTLGDFTKERVGDEETHLDRWRERVPGKVQVNALGAPGTCGFRTDWIRSDFLWLAFCCSSFVIALVRLGKRQKKEGFSLGAWLGFCVLFTAKPTAKACCGSLLQSLEEVGRFELSSAE